MSTKTPDEGLIQAYLDDELSDEDRRELEGRFDASPAWAGAYREAVGHADTLADAISLLDERPSSEDAPAWISALSGRAARASVVDKRSRESIPLARAAVLVLVFGGMLAAGLPGSPVREWFSNTRSAASTETPTEPIGSMVGDEASPLDADEVGVRVSPEGGAVHVAVSQLPEGGEVRVRLVDGLNAGVFGPTGTRFRTAAGRVDVLNPEQVLRVEIPRSLAEATITVGGEVYLHKVADRIEVSGPVSDSTGTEIRFRPEGN